MPARFLSKAIILSIVSPACLDGPKLSYVIPTAIGERVMVQSGEVVLARIEHILFGQPAAAALADLAARRGAQRVVLAASDSLRHGTGEIAAIEAALGNRWAGTWSGMRPHAPRSDLIALTAAVRAADADLIVAIGGGSLVDAVKIVAL